MSENVFPDPTIHPVKNGYLARTPQECRYQFAVVRGSKEDAARHYEDERVGWAELHRCKQLSSDPVSN